MTEYRIANADFAIVGLETEIGGLGRRLADELAARGIRLGVVTLLEGDDAIGESVDFLLGPLQALAVVEPVWSEGLLTRGIQRVLGTHSELEWASNAARRPVYCMTHEGAITRDALRIAVEAMLTYGDHRLHVACAA